MSTPAPAERDAVWTRLACLPEYDLALGLRNVGGNEAVLLRVLARFVDMYGEGLPVLLEVPAAPTRVRWQEAAHGLRGVCATLGASGLQRRLLDFEAALRRGDELTHLAAEARDLHLQVQRWAAELRRALRPPA